MAIAYSGQEIKPSPSLPLHQAIWSDCDDFGRLREACGWPLPELPISLTYGVIHTPNPADYELPMAPYDANIDRQLDRFDLAAQEIGRIISTYDRCLSPNIAGTSRRRSYETMIIPVLHAAPEEADPAQQADACPATHQELIHQIASSEIATRQVLDAKRRLALSEQTDAAGLDGFMSRMQRIPATIGQFVTRIKDFKPGLNLLLLNQALFAAYTEDAPTKSVALRIADYTRSRLWLQIIPTPDCMPAVRTAHQNIGRFVGTLLRRGDTNSQTATPPHILERAQQLRAQTREHLEYLASPPPTPAPIMHNGRVVGGLRNVFVNTHLADTCVNQSAPQPALLRHNDHIVGGLRNVFVVNIPARVTAEPAVTQPRHTRWYNFRPNQAA